MTAIQSQASTKPCGLSRPKALQTQGCDWVLTEYYDRVLRQLNDNRTAKEGAWGLRGPCPHVEGPQKFLLTIRRPAKDSCFLQVDPVARPPLHRLAQPYYLRGHVS